MRVLLWCYDIWNYKIYEVSFVKFTPVLLFYLLHTCTKNNGKMHILYNAYTFIKFIKFEIIKFEIMKFMKLSKFMIMKFMKFSKFVIMKFIKLSNCDNEIDVIIKILNNQFHLLNLHLFFRTHQARNNSKLHILKKFTCVLLNFLKLINLSNYQIWNLKFIKFHLLNLRLIFHIIFWTHHAKITASYIYWRNERVLLWIPWNWNTEMYEIIKFEIMKYLCIFIEIMKYL